MFYSIKELVQQADLDFQGNVAELMIRTEFELTGREREEVLLLMERNLEVMKASVELGLSEKKSRSGLTGGDAAKLDHYIKKGKTLSDLTVLSAARNAIAVNEHNAKMGLVCATPTAGSAGCLPAVLTAAIEKLNLTHEQQLDFLFAAGAFGLVIANNASISGAEGGCQAEVGSASAMSAAALTLAGGGSPYQASQALAFVIKNMLGLICDPVAGLVEVQCRRRGFRTARSGRSRAFDPRRRTTLRHPRQRVRSRTHRRHCEGTHKTSACGELRSNGTTQEHRQPHGHHPRNPRRHGSSLARARHRET